MLESVGQFCLQRSEELSSSRSRSICRAWAANQDNTRGERVGIRTSHSVAKFGPHGPCATEGKSSLNDSVEEGLPSSGCSPFTLRFRLLERVIDGDWECRMRLLSKPVHSSCHTIQEENFRLLFTAVSIRCGHQLLSFGNRHRG